MSTAACGGARATSEPAVVPSAEPADTYDDTPTPTASSTASSDTPSPAPATLALDAHGFPLGTRIESTSKLGIEVLFQVDGPNGRPITVEDYGVVSNHRVVELLGVRATAARKLRVSFQDRSTTHIVNGRQKHQVSPVSGRTYVLEARDQGLAILDGAGHEVTHSEGVVLAQLFRSLGTPDEMARAISGASMQLGRPVPALAEALKRDIEHSVEGRVWSARCPSRRQGRGRPRTPTASCSPSCCRWASRPRAAGLR